jgi:TetR/AcrR family transcriptional regulator, transcriptional repressor for nem operon
MDHPELAGEIILSLLQGMGSSHASLLFQAAEVGEDGVAEIADRIAAVHAGYMEAVERVLGAPSHCLVRADADAVMAWVTTLRENTTA